ncbi:MAG: DUF4924 family protein [Flavobacteriia bacterium]|nr:DUF4924 family protein [Flavobacteriia bacterium]
MSIVNKLKENNIIEYILYMYQMENFLRHFKLDIHQVTEYLVDKNLSEDQQKEQIEWFLNLIKQIKNEKIEQQGHLSMLNEILIELSYLHNTLLNLSNDEQYKKMYNNAIEHVEFFKQKSNLKNKNHIELMIHALFMKWLMVIQKKEISKETAESLEIFRKILVHLGKSYHQMKQGKLNFFNN